MKKLALLTLLALAFVACSVDIPVGVIGEAKMERILYDYHQAQATDTLTVEDVFAKHGITEADFDSSMTWYASHASHLLKIYKRIDARMEREAVAKGLLSEEQLFENLGEDGDTAVVWRAGNVCLQGRRGENIVSFTFQADSTARPGDTYALRLRNRFIVEAGQREAYVMLAARYEGDTLVSNVTRVGGDFDSNLQLRQCALTDTARLTSVQITFYFPYEEETQEKFRLWMVTRPMLLRFRHDVAEQEETRDTLLADTIQKDTTAHARPEQLRLTPQQMREQAEGAKTIKVTKQRKVIMPPQGQRQRR